jgi:hypothetical protein
LSEVPAVTFGILDAAASLAVGLVGRLLQDDRTRLHGTLKQTVHVADVHVQILCDGSEPLRIAVRGATRAAPRARKASLH